MPLVLPTYSRVVGRGLLLLEMVRPGQPLAAIRLVAAVGRLWPAETLAGQNPCLWAYTKSSEHV